jgi:hypothetical protein
MNNLVVDYRRPAVVASGLGDRSRIVSVGFALDAKRCRHRPGTHTMRAFRAISTAINNAAGGDVK